MAKIIIYDDNFRARVEATVDAFLTKQTNLKKKTKMTED